MEEMPEIISLSFFFLQSPQKSPFYLMQTLASPSPFREQRCHHINHQMIFYMPRGRTCVFCTLFYAFHTSHFHCFHCDDTALATHITVVCVLRIRFVFLDVAPDIVPKPFRPRGRQSCIVSRWVFFLIRKCVRFLHA